MKQINGFTGSVVRDLKNINLNHFFYFNTVAECESLTAAAKALNITQPTLSQQINKLETTLSTPLFLRKGRSIKLNDNGHFLYEYTSKIFESIEEMVANFNYQKYHQKEKTIKIGVSKTSPKLLVTKILNPLFSDEKMGLSICEHTLPTLIDELRRDRLTFFLSEHLGDTSSFGDDIEVKKIFSATYHVVVNVDNPLASMEGPLSKVLNQADYFKFSKTNQIQRRIDRFFLENDVVPIVMGESDDLHTACVITQNKPCFSVLPETIFESYEGLVSIAKLELSEPMSISAFFLADRDKESQVRDLLSKISQ